MPRWLVGNLLAHTKKFTILIVNVVFPQVCDEKEIDLRNLQAYIVAENIKIE